MTKRQKFFSALKRFFKNVFTKNIRFKVIALVFAVPVAMLLVNFSGLAGAVLANLVIMAILVVLLVYEYLSIRKRLAEKTW